MSNASLRANVAELRFGQLHEGLKFALQRAEEYHSAAPFSQTYQVARTVIQVNADNETDLAKMTTAGWERAHNDAEPDCRVYIASSEQSENARPIWGSRLFEERAAEQELSASPYCFHFFQDHAFWQIFDADRRVGFQFADAGLGPPPWDEGSPLRNFLAWQLASEHGAVLHAGSLSIFGRGFLVAGDGGSGKSGLTIQSIQRGWASAGDDYIFADAGASEVLPLYSVLKQDVTGLNRLGLEPEKLPGASLNWKGKYQFDFAALRRDASPIAHSLDAILLPSVGHAKTEVTPVSRKEAFLRLAPSCVRQTPSARDHVFSVAAQLARKLPAFDLSLGPDPEEIDTSLTKFAETL